MTIEDRIKKAKDSSLELIDTQLSKIEEDIKNIIYNQLIQIVELSLVDKSASRFFSFSQNKELEKKVDDIIRVFGNNIEDTIINRAILAKYLAEKRNNDKLDDYLILAFLALSIKGRTLRNRINGYTAMFKQQIEAYIASAIYFKYGKQKVIADYMKHLKNPLGGDVLTQAYKKNNIFSNPLIQAKGITYGQGVMTSVFDNLTRLSINNVTRSYSYANTYIWNKRNEIIGYRTFRNSSYPCQICDDATKILHNKNDIVVPLHPNCVCGMYPVYKNDLL